MRKLILTRGCPGSGKTFWSKAFVDASDGSVVNINRDDLRWMLNNYKFANDIEELITLTRNYLTEMALSSGKDVIWSDTNLPPKNRNQANEIAKKLGGVEVVIKDFTDVPLELCIERNKKRPNPVPEHVIHQMYNTHIRIKQDEQSLTPAIICDLDGTLALCDKRSPFDFMRCYEDEVNKPILNILNSFYPAFARIIFITGRQEKSRQETIAWLKDKCGISFGYDLYMTKDGDQRPSPVIKTEHYTNNIQGKYQILFVLEDRKKNVDEWRRLGLTCLQNDEGNF